MKKKIWFFLFICSVIAKDFPTEVISENGEVFYFDRRLFGDGQFDEFDQDHKVRSYLFTIPTYNSRFNSHINSHFLLK